VLVCEYSFRGARIVKGGDQSFQPFDMFSVHKQKMSVAAIRRSKGELWVARVFAILQYTRKHGQAREWRV
jgi:hypothetical protein